MYNGQDTKTKNTSHRTNLIVALLKHMKMHPYELSQSAYQYRRSNETEAKWET